MLTSDRSRPRTRSVALLATAAAAAALIPLTAGAAEAAPTGYARSCPAAGRITQGWHSGHDGVDIANTRGTPIYSAGPGTVIVSGTASGYGQWIRIRHDDGTVTE